MNKTLWLFLLPLVPLNLLGQEEAHTSTVTLSAGGQIYSYNGFDQHRGGPAFDGRYEYRLWKNLSLEGGVDILLPSARTGELIPVMINGQIASTVGLNCSACVLVPSSDHSRVTLLPFGLKGILPVANGRVELFGGFGGAYAWNSSYRRYYGRHRNALLAQASLGGRVALDRGRHFWLGTSVRSYSDFGSGRQTWVSWTADFGLRFGH